MSLEICKNQGNQKNLTRKRWLVAEDDPAVMEFILEIAEAIGVDVVAAVDRGDAAIRAIRKYLPDEVLTDYGLMDGQKGLDVVREARKRGIPANVITGNQLKVQRLIERAGIDDVGVFAKPIDVRALTRRLVARRP
jgi:CheY-like chemotaxis protein